MTTPFTHIFFIHMKQIGNRVRPRQAKPSPQWDAAGGHVTVLAEVGGIEDLSVAGSNARSKKQRDKQKKTRGKDGESRDRVHLSNYGISSKSCKGP